MRAIATASLGLTLLANEAHEPGLASFDRGQALADDAGDRVASWFIELIHALALQYLDRPDDALDRIGRAQTAVDQLGEGQGVFKMTVLRLLVGTNVPSVIWDQAEQMEGLARPMFAQTLAKMTWLVRAELEAGVGKDTDALASLERSRAIPDPFGLLDDQLAGTRARILRMLGDANSVVQADIAQPGRDGTAPIAGIESLLAGLLPARNSPDPATAASPPVPVRAPVHRTLLLARLGRFLALLPSDEAMATFDQALQLAEDHAPSSLLAETVAHAARGAFALGHEGRALELQRRVVTLADQHGDACRRARGRLDLAAILGTMERVADARRRIQESLEIAKNHELRALGAEAHARFALLDSIEDHPAVVREELLVAIDGTSARVEWPTETDIDILYALLAALDGEHETAHQLLHRAERWTREEGADARQAAIDDARLLLKQQGASPKRDAQRPVMRLQALERSLDRLETVESRAFLTPCGTTSERVPPSPASGLSDGPEGKPRERDG